MKYIVYTAAAIYFFLPLQFALNPTAGIDLAIVRLCVALLSIFFCVFSLAQRYFFIPRGWIAAFFTAFFMWIFFSLFFSPVFSWTLRKILFFATFFPLYYMLTTLFVQKKDALYRIVRWTVYGSALISLVGVVQFLLQFVLPLNTLLSLWEHLTPFFLGDTFSESVISHNSWLVHVGSRDLMRAVAFFPDPHVFSFYLGITAPLALGLFFMSKKTVWLYCFLIIFVADLLTFSRGGYIGLSAGLIIGVMFLWPQISIRIRHFLVLIIFSLCVALIIPQNPITERFLSSFADSDTSASHRIELWSQALEEMGQRPFVGTGLGAYAYTINPRADYRTPIYVHNLFLDISVELGLIGLLFFCGMLISTIITLYQKRTHYMATFVIISMSIFLVHSIFDTALLSVHVLPLILLLFAIGSYYENNAKQHSPDHQ
jgi:O-antigen ligase